jgi:hypothetical protein
LSLGQLALRAITKHPRLLDPAELAQHQVLAGAAAGQNAVGGAAGRQIGNAAAGSVGRGGRPVAHSRKRHGARPNIGEPDHCVADTLAARADDAIQPDDFASAYRYIHLSTVAGWQAGYLHDFFAGRRFLPAADFVPRSAHQFRNDVSSIHVFGDGKGIDEKAVLHQADPIRHFDDLFHVMGDKDHRHATLSSAADDVQELLVLAHSEHRSRLVEDEDPWPARQRLHYFN